MKKTSSKILIGIIMVLTVSILLSCANMVSATDTNAIVISGNSSNTQNIVINTTNTTNTINIINTTPKVNNTTTTLPQTGENDVYIVAGLITVCAISAVYAYRKIRDYNIK